MRTYAAIALAASGNGDPIEAVAALERLPADAPARGTLATALLWPLLANLQVDLTTLDRLARVLAIAEADPPATPKWPGLRAGARVAALMADTLADRVTDPHAALAELDRLATEAGPDTPFVPILESARIGLTLMTALHDGDESAYRRLPEQLAAMRARAGPGARSLPLEPQLALIDALVEAMHARRRGTDPAVALRRVRAAAERLPADDPLRGMALQHLGVLAGDTTPPGTDWTTDQDRALHRGFAAAQMLGRGEETDPAKIETAIGHLREAVALTPPDDLNRAFHLAGLAMGLFRRTEVTNSTAGLDEALAVITEARRLAGDADHPHWSLINDILDAVQQRLGHAPTPAWQDAMRGHTFHVMVQSDLAGATMAAADAGRDALDFARRSLHDRDPAGAIRALDAGRGLALFAATEVGRVPARLRAAGRADLAVRWDAALASGDPERLPTTLRREAFRVLTGQGMAALLDPPELPEIRAALRKLDADVLVYLAPGERGLPGHAVLAPADGPPAYLTLPNLHLDQDVDVERYLSTAARRDLGPADDEPDAAFTGSLDALCRWAWRAAMGPIVDQYLPRLRDQPSGRPPRIVLVPTGRLALIPWPAARRPDGRYAIESAAISQVVSARMLCHAAALPPVPLAPTGLIVGDPDTGGVADDLPAARVEAYAIRRTFYPGARYVGRRRDDSVSPTGPGTAAEVRDWLVSSSPGAGAVLHLACHGFASTGTGTAYLLLAGGDRLAAETLGPLLARAPERAIGLIVLAGCHTGRAISGYDEAYSLGTAFLAAGVRSVLSTLWPIPDAATSVLMFMFHHYLRVERRPVWDALHQAQLWMIDPKRRLPDRMPGELRDELARTDPAEAAAWAGFVHWGR
ncbi:CHAT domain-containing protein [Actinoplanes sp. L3-i22]|uniref:CHAT domain-containing protein n=1 Tax=Actinoplanes sp. L3-i22 TaxID=2836373 RepID=UPI001C8606FB|nr:CHAT domain-containing protein [Actinoplanes sp. L3-i22]